METRVFPQADDIVNRLQESAWLDAPEQSLTGESYAAQLLWRYIDERAPQVLPDFLARLGASDPTRSAGALLVSTYSRDTGQPFAAVFGRFAVSTVFEYSSSITPLRDLGPRERTKGRVSPWAVAPLLVSPDAHSISIRVTSGHAQVALAYQEDGAPGSAPRVRLVTPKTVKGSLRFTLPRTAVAWPELVIANGDPAATATYAVTVT
jgi:hypothetical protein